MEEKDERRWQILKSEYLIRRPWLTARRDHVRLPGGVENEEYYVLEYPDWVNVIAITEDGRFLLERQYRHGIGATCYELCAGVVEAGEDPLEAARREMLEETGYGDGEWRYYMCLSPNASAMNNRNHTFLATGVRPVAPPHPEATEDITLHLMSTDEVRDLLQRGEVPQALMAAPLWRYFAENKLL